MEWSENVGTSLNDLNDMNDMNDMNDVSGHHHFTIAITHLYDYDDPPLSSSASACSFGRSHRSHTCSASSLDIGATRRVTVAPPSTPEPT